MDLGQFTHLIETYGADLARWPDTERREGAQLVERSPEARKSLDDARQLDRLFAEDRVVLDDVRRQAIVNAAMRRIRTLPRSPERGWGGSSWGWLFVPRFGAAFATMLVMGVLVGLELTGPVGQRHGDSLAGIDALFDPAGLGVEGFIQ